MRATILSSEEISTFRRYIDRKHAQVPAWRRAHILADALERVVDDRLPALPDEPRRRLRRKLLDRGAELSGLGADDVLQECLALDLRREELLRPVVAWSRVRLTPLAPDDPTLETILLRWHREAPAAACIERLRQEAAGSAFAGAPPLGDARKRNGAAAAASCLLLFAGALGLSSAFGSDPPPAAGSLPPSPIAEAAPAPAAEVADARNADELAYAKVDEERLKAYLRGRDSLLAEEPYFGAIVAAAASHDVHPLLLFAITGQEQSFVPSTHERAEAIASNPFNVYGSWEHYRTDIADAAGLAARLVAKRLEDRPDDVDPIRWINASYAEDPNWWKGVSWFFVDMKKQIERDPR